VVVTWVQVTVPSVRVSPNPGAVGVEPAEVVPPVVQSSSSPDAAWVISPIAVTVERPTSSR
jgi:hypothetical protein